MRNEPGNDPDDHGGLEFHLRVSGKYWALAAFLVPIAILAPGALPAVLHHFAPH